MMNTSIVTTKIAPYVMYSLPNLKRFWNFSGFSSVFWGRFLKSETDKNDSGTNGNNKNHLNFTDIALRIGGGIGAGILVEHFQKKGEENLHRFPVYDPHIKQLEPNPSINFGDIGNLKKLVEGQHFIHVTLKKTDS